MKKSITFLCALCKVPVTQKVTFTIKPPRIPKRIPESISYPPRGHYAIGNPRMYDKSDKNYTFNLKDLINIVQHPGRRAGCCGSDGCQGPNILCTNRHEIGTEFSDCHHEYHFVEVNPDNVMIDEN
jgi:hypothetical protein